MDCKSGESRFVISSEVTGSEGVTDSEGVTGSEGVTDSDIFITFGGIGVGLGCKNVFWMVTVGAINGVADSTFRDSIFSADDIPIIISTRETDTSNTPIITVEIPTHFEATMAYHLPETDKITLSIYSFEEIISVVMLKT